MNVLATLEKNTRTQPLPIFSGDDMDQMDFVAWFKRSQAECRQHDYSETNSCESFQSVSSSDAKGFVRRRLCSNSSIDFAILFEQKPSKPDYLSLQAISNF